MKYQSFLLTIAMTVMLSALSSCDKTHDQVIEFLTQLQTAQQSGDKGMIAQLYPAAAGADSLSIKFNPETMKVESATGDTITAELDDGTNLVLVRQANGSLQAVASHGLFAYPADRLDLAQKTGQYKPSLNDAENAQRMTDTLFTKWMQPKIDEKLNSLVKITKSTLKITDDYYTRTRFVHYIVSVTNNTDYEIGANEYTISVNELSDYWFDEYRCYGTGGIDRKTERKSKTLTGKPIPAKGTASYAWTRSFEELSFSGYDNFRIQCTLNYTPSQAISSLCDFTGNEYEEYLTTKDR